MKSIAVYCSSSNKVDDIYKEEAKKVGDLLAKKGIRLVYGGGNMGLMGVLSNSAINSGGDVYGVITNHLIEIEKRNELNLEVASIEIEEGDLLLFPSYLPHKVSQNNSNDDRIVISFNVDITK